MLGLRCSGHGVLNHILAFGWTWLWSGDGQHGMQPDVRVIVHVLFRVLWFVLSSLFLVKCQIFCCYQSVILHVECIGDRVLSSWVLRKIPCQQTQLSPLTPNHPQPWCLLQSNKSHVRSSRRDDHNSTRVTVSSSSLHVVSLIGGEVLGTQDLGTRFHEKI